jgi:GNAT superfamily N-acetyltransferase
VLTPADWRIWRELRLAALADAPDAFGARLADWQGDGDREERWRARLQIPGGEDYVAYVDGRPVGMASGVPAEDGDGSPGVAARDGSPGVAARDGSPGVAARDGSPGVAARDGVELISMWVSPVARGKGVGDALIAAVERFARASGAPVLRLAVRAYNASAIRLYERSGLTDVGEAAADNERLMEKVLPADRDQ